MAYDDAIRLGANLGLRMLDRYDESKQLWEDRLAQKQATDVVQTLEQQEAEIRQRYAEQGAPVVEELSTYVEWMGNSQHSTPTEVPTQKLNEDGTMATRQVIRTDKGDIDFQQYLYAQNQAMRMSASREKEINDLWMGTKSRYLDNKFVQGAVDAKIANQIQMMEMEYKQARFGFTELAQLETTQMAQEGGTERVQMQIEAEQADPRTIRARKIQEIEAKLEANGGDISVLTEAEKLLYLHSAKTESAAQYTGDKIRDGQFQPEGTLEGEDRGKDDKAIRRALTAEEKMDQIKRDFGVSEITDEQREQNFADTKAIYESHPEIHDQWELAEPDPSTGEARIRNKETGKTQVIALPESPEAPDLGGKSVEGPDLSLLGDKLDKKLQGEAKRNVQQMEQDHKRAEADQRAHKTGRKLEQIDTLEDGTPVYVDENGQVVLGR